MDAATKQPVWLKWRQDQNAQKWTQGDGQDRGEGKITRGLCVTGFRVSRRADSKHHVIGCAEAETVNEAQDDQKGDIIDQEIAAAGNEVQSGGAQRHLFPAEAGQCTAGPKAGKYAADGVHA